MAYGLRNRLKILSSDFHTLNKSFENKQPPYHICQVTEREVGGGSISYEDDWTFAKLNSSQGLRNPKSGAPTLKHYWNISGQERQRIISCPQVLCCN